MANVKIELKFDEETGDSAKITNEGVPLSMIHYHLTTIINDITKKLLNEASEMQVPDSEVKNYIAARFRVDLERFHGMKIKKDE